MFYQSEIMSKIRNSYCLFVYLYYF